MACHSFVVPCCDLNDLQALADTLANSLSLTHMRFAVRHLQSYPGTRHAMLQLHRADVHRRHSCDCQSIHSFQSLFTRGKLRPFLPSPAGPAPNDVNGCSKAASLRSENREHGQSNVVCWRGMKHGVPTHFVCFQPSSLLLVPTLRHFSLYSHATHKCSRVMITFVRV